MLRHCEGDYPAVDYRGQSPLWRQAVKDTPDLDENNPHLPLETAGARGVSKGQVRLMEGYRRWRSAGCDAALAIAYFLSFLPVGKSNRLIISRRKSGFVPTATSISSLWSAGLSALCGSAILAIFSSPSAATNVSAAFFKSALLGSYATMTPLPSAVPISFNSLVFHCASYFYHLPLAIFDKQSTELSGQIRAFFHRQCHGERKKF